MNQSDYEAINHTANLFNTTLLFPKLKQEHFGLYTLQINNSRGDSTTHTINFTTAGNPARTDHEFNDNVRFVIVFKTYHRQ